MRRSTPQKKIDDRAFPIRVKFTTPRLGFGNRILDLHDWLNTEVGRGHYATHPAPAFGTGSLGISLRDIELARALVRAAEEAVRFAAGVAGDGAHNWAGPSF